MMKFTVYKSWTEAPPEETSSVPERKNTVRVNAIRWRFVAAISKHCKHLPSDSDTAQADLDYMRQIKDFWITPLI
jgi:hypothetical protein